MSSHHDWAEHIIAEHDRLKPFAPENGQPLKFKVGDPVIFTNEAGIEYPLTVTGLYQPDSTNTMYATGRRYLLDSDSWWFPVPEASLRLDESRVKETSRA